MARKIFHDPHGIDVGSLFPEIISKHNYKILMEESYKGDRFKFYIRQRDNNKWYVYEEVDDFCGDLGLTHEEQVIWTLKFGRWLPTHTKEYGIEFDNYEYRGFRWV